MGALDGRVAVVIGASRGIGKGCALELASAGAVVYAAARSASVEEIERAGGGGGGSGSVVGVRCDCRDDVQIGALFERVAAERGRLDVLVNSAFFVSGEMDPRAPFWETPIGYWDDLLDVGPRSAYVASHFAAQLMVPQGSGLIANVSSAGAVGYFHHLAYGVGKTALDRFTRDAARAPGRRGVTIVSIWPHIARTETAMRLGPQRIDLEGSESQRFTGRAIVALACDPQAARWNGRAVTSRALSEDYGFVDEDGAHPRDARSVLWPER